eukprot:scaffold88840_cov29-Tisochrysis_lutea.AAC.6
MTREKHTRVCTRLAQGATRRGLIANRTYAVPRPFACDLQSFDSCSLPFQVDYYHAASLICLSDEKIVAKAKADLDTMLGDESRLAKVVDAAVVRLPNAVNWYFPGSYDKLPTVRSSDIPNVFFAGDLVRSRHGSWSQEKAYVTGIEAANAVLGQPLEARIVPLQPDEPHVIAGRAASKAVRTALGGGDPSRGPSLVDFLWR